MSQHPDDDRAVIDPDLDTALLLALRPIDPPAGRKAALRASILQSIKHRPAGRAAVTVRAEEGVWEPFAPLIERKALYADGRGQAFMLRMQPGASLPAHPHEVDEECLVLQGQVSIGDIELSDGDYHLAPAGLLHGTLTTRTGALMFVRYGA